MEFQLPSNRIILRIRNSKKISRLISRFSILFVPLSLPFTKQWCLLLFSFLSRRFSHSYAASAVVSTDWRTMCIIHPLSRGVYRYRTRDELEIFCSSIKNISLIGWNTFWPKIFRLFIYADHSWLYLLLFFEKIKTMCWSWRNNVCKFQRYEKT